MHWYALDALVTIGITMVFGMGAQPDGLYPGPKIWCYAPVNQYNM